MGPQEVGIIEQLGHTQQGKLASQQFAYTWLRDIQHFFELTWCDFFLYDQSEDVLVQISL